LSLAEGQSLSRLARRTTDVTVMKRAMVILHSHQGFSPPKIAEMIWWSEDWVRRIIKDFNQMGMDALHPKKAPGAPPMFSKEQRQAIVDLALSSPRDHGMPLPTWSLERLRDTAIREGIVEHISKETVRKILHEEATSYQAVKTWKQSNDPKFKQKLAKIRRLTNRKHNPPIVVAADEMGPIQLKPYGGRTWAREGSPDRVRATYKRTQGVRYLMGGYDFYHDRMFGWTSRRKRGVDWAEHLRFIRSKYPNGGRIYLIQDNLSAHTTPQCIAEAERLNIEFVPIPTNASHLNPIETHFGKLQDLALTGTDYRDWPSLQKGLQDAMRWRNKHPSDRRKKVRRLLWSRH
jgi:transposase